MNGVFTFYFSCKNIFILLYSLVVKQGTWDLVPVWFQLKLAFNVFCFVLFFFFFFLAALFDQVNRKQCIYALFTNLQISLFSNFFIKNKSLDAIHTFKNYFVTVFSVSIFSFSKNKFNLNGPLILPIPRMEDSYNLFYW